MFEYNLGSVHPPIVFAFHGTMNTWRCDARWEADCFRPSDYGTVTLHAVLQSADRIFHGSQGLVQRRLNVWGGRTRIAFNGSQPSYAYATSLNISAFEGSRATALDITGVNQQPRARRCIKNGRLLQGHAVNPGANNYGGGFR